MQFQLNSVLISIVQYLVNQANVESEHHHHLPLQVLDTAWSSLVLLILWQRTGHSSCSFDLFYSPFSVLYTSGESFAKARSTASLGKAPALSTTTRDSRTHRWQLFSQPAGTCTSGVWPHPWRNHRFYHLQPKRWFTEAKTDWIFGKVN